MHLAGALSRLALIIGALYACSLLSACTRASASALLPNLTVGVALRRTRSASGSEALEGQAERWAAVAQLGLQFRPRFAAGDVPLRVELAPETWIAPCDEDDIICLQEAAEAESELHTAFGELQ